MVGPAVDLTYPYEHLGAGPEDLASLRKSPFFEALKSAKRPLVVVGSGVLGRPDRAQVLQQVRPLELGVGALQRWSITHALPCAGLPCASTDACMSDQGCVPA